MQGDVAHQGRARRVAILGPVEVHHGNGLPVALSRNQALVLALLVSRIDRPVPLDVLAEALWAATPPRNPSASLRSLVARLRYVLGDHPGLLASESGGYRLRCGRDQVDVCRFEDLAARSATAVGAARLQLLDDAVSLWRGDAYGEFAECEWLRGEAQRLEELRATVRERRAEALMASGRVEEAAAELDGLLTAHPQREHTRSRLMEALSAMGRHTDALRLYEQWRLELGERGLSPSPTLRETEGRVLRHTATSPDVSARWRSSLPRPISSFIGREGDVADIDQRLTRARLVTLVGVGGVGKTRLAIAVAGEVADRYGGVVWFCDLSALGNDDEVAPLVATTTGLREQGSDVLLVQLAQHLRGGPALVVLDNCEHVLAGAAAVAEALTTHTQDVVVLATSRQRLGADGEWVRPVEPLPAIDVDSAAVRLFQDRRGHVAPARIAPMQAEDRAVIARVCRKLDGLPLAIELAAARLRGLTACELEHRLDQRFSILVDRGRPQSRHRSLGAMIDWSYDALEEPTRRVLRRLCIFRGSFSLEAAEEVLETSEAHVADVAGAMLTLVDCSLLQWSVTPTGSRYSALESIRAFGVDRLREGGELPLLAGAHADWAVRLCEAASVGLAGVEEGAWAMLVYAQLDDLRVALDWLVDRHDERALRLCSALHFFALWRAESEIFRWAELAAAAVSRPGSAWLPAAHAAAGSGAWQRGDLEAARLAVDRGVAAAAGIGEQVMQRPLHVAGDVALLTGDLDRAIECYGRGRDLAWRAGDASQAVWDEGSRALAYSYGGDLQEARIAGRAARDLAERSGSPSALAYAHYVCGEIEIDGDRVEARWHLDRAVSLAVGVGSRYLIALAEASQASLAARTGEVGEALRSYEAVLTTWHTTGSWTGLSVTLRSLVTLLIGTGHLREAAVLHGAVTRPSKGPAPYGGDAGRLVAAETTLIAHLGPEEFTALSRRGQALTQDDLTLEALRAIGMARTKRE